MLKRLCNPRPVFGAADFAAAESMEGDRRETEKAYARLFSTEDGRRVLGHMQAMTFLRAYGPDAADAQLRHAEGQRALMASVMRMIAAGKKS